jgi:hypothetical protein
MSYENLHRETGSYVLEEVDKAGFPAGIPERIRAKIDKILTATSLEQAERFAKDARDSIDVNVLAASTIGGSAAERLEEQAKVVERRAALARNAGDERAAKSLTKEVEHLRERAAKAIARR